MRVIVFSDSHNNFQVLQSIVLAQSKADIFLHLGDGEMELEDLQRRFPKKRIYGVAGNCDWRRSNGPTGEILCEGKKIFYTHGHTYGVKSGLGDFLRAARKAGAHIALFGHTHTAYNAYADGMYVMNPGAISSPRGGPRSYGMIDITGAGIAVHIISGRGGVE